MAPPLLAVVRCAHGCVPCAAGTEAASLRDRSPAAVLGMLLAYFLQDAGPTARHTNRVRPTNVRRVRVVRDSYRLGTKRAPTTVCCARAVCWLRDHTTRAVCAARVRISQCLSMHALGNLETLT